MRQVVMVMLACSVPWFEASAQAPAPRRDQAVRVTAPDLGLERERYFFERLEGDTLFLRTGSVEPSVVAIPRSSVGRLEVRRKALGPGARRGSVYGAVTLGSTGLVLGLASIRECEGWLDLFCGATASTIVQATAIFAGVGAVGGALIGALIPTETWREIRLPRVRVDVAPQPAGRVGLGASLGF